MKILAIILVTLSLALAEPPGNENEYLSTNRYLPPQKKYLPPQNKYLPSSTPTASKYLPPVGPSVIQRQAAPKPKYEAPSRRYISPNTLKIYGVPSGSYGVPSSTYGIPSGTEYVAPISSYKTPSNEQGTSKPTDVYGVPYETEGYEDQSNPASYDFEYHVQDAQSGNDFGHSEQRQGDKAQGKYFVLLPDGRLQTVEYTADKEGYKPRISYQLVGYSGGGYPANSGGYQY